VPDGGPAPVHEEFLPGWELPASEVQVGVAVDCRAGAQPGGIRGLAFPFHLSTAALGLAVGSAGDGPPTEACLGCGGVRMARVRREQRRLGAAVWAYWPSVGRGPPDWGPSVREQAGWQRHGQETMAARWRVPALSLWMLGDCQSWELAVKRDGQVASRRVAGKPAEPELPFEADPLAWSSEAAGLPQGRPDLVGGSAGCPTGSEGARRVAPAGPRQRVYGPVGFQARPFAPTGWSCLLRPGLPWVKRARWLQWPTCGRSPAVGSGSLRLR